MNGILRRREVEKIVGLSRSTIYAAMAIGTFPRPVKIGVRAVGWYQTDIENWVTSRAINYSAFLGDGQ